MTIQKESSVNWDDIPLVRESVRELPPEGNHNGDIAAVVYVGVQPSKFRATGQSTLVVRFEFEVDGGRRYGLWKRYNYTLHNKGDFYGLITAALGKAFVRNTDGSFDPRTLVGHSVMVEVVHTEKGEKTYADVGAVSRHPKGLPEFRFDEEVIVPQWIIDMRNRRLDKPSPSASSVAQVSQDTSVAPEGDGDEKLEAVGCRQADYEEKAGIDGDA